ncbi:hypothetical protein DPMN_009432 [Dreissena polymorpha]|uniref:Uncharacterized protein n=1 Tax=Dreissena polymorpha TaxID=45954 RepID=A0A9D4MWZ5_DREPO|nr:hypothetical protein DPMN_009432 [Dreissena polymorpha]
MRLLGEYSAKLRVDGGVLPDPMMLKSGWKGENAGMNLWPSIYITDISAYIDGTSPSAVVHKLMNEYKLGKAYRYFDNSLSKYLGQRSFNTPNI